jgi:ER membrane protein complex subunit 8/9
MSPAYTIDSDAYYKIFFHVAKHPRKSVNGVLLGIQDRPGGAVEITDAVPLLHHWTSLSPMMEIGLDLVCSFLLTCNATKLNKRFKAFQYAESAELKVVGYYQACERLVDTALAPVGEKVASKIKAQFDDAIALVVCQIF